jgi:hypothetical protein
MGIKKYMDASFNPYDVQNPDRKLQDSIAQCSNTTATTASQTTWHRYIAVYTLYIVYTVYDML